MTYNLSFFKKILLYILTILIILFICDKKSFAETFYRDFTFKVGETVNIQNNLDIVGKTIYSAVTCWKIPLKDNGKTEVRTEIPGLTYSRKCTDLYITGTPKTVGVYEFYLTNTGIVFDDTTHVTVTIKPANLVIDRLTLPQGQMGVAYPSTKLTATGGVAPYQWSVTALPKGLTFNKTSNAIEGTPTETFNGVITVSITDAEGTTKSLQQNLEIKATDLVIDKLTLPQGQMGVAYPSTKLTATGGVAPYQWSVTALPKGLTFNKTSNAIEGTPTETFNGVITVSITDAEGTTKSLQQNLEIKATDLVIDKLTLPQGQMGVAYPSTKLTATGGVAPYQWSVTALPKGLTFNKTSNAIEGTPTETFNGVITVSITDADGSISQRAYQVIINGDSLQARDLVMDVVAGEAVSINLTDGNPKGIVTAARIVTSAHNKAGQASIQKSEQNYNLYFKASKFFSGQTFITYELLSAYGSSKQAVITINVHTRPDPSKDPEVIGVINAQVETAMRLGKGQIKNIHSRLKQLHDQENCHENSLALNIGIGEEQLQIKNSQLGVSVPNKCTNSLRKLAFWTDGQVSLGKNNHDKNFKNSYTNMSLSGGIDYRFTPYFVGGIGLGYGHETTEIGPNITRTTGSLIALSTYGGYHEPNGLFIDTIVGYGWLNFRSDRYVSSNNTRALGERKGSQVYGSTSVGYQYNNDSWKISPYIRADAVHTRLDRFSEDRAGSNNLTYDKHKFNKIDVSLGLAVDYQIKRNGYTITPKLRLEYTHDLSASSRTKVGFSDMMGGMPSTVKIEPNIRNNFKLETGLDLTNKNSWKAGLSYELNFSPQLKSTEHNFRLRIAKPF